MLAYLDALTLAEPIQAKLWQLAQLTLTQVSVLRRLRAGSQTAGKLGQAVGLSPASPTPNPRIGMLIATVNATSTLIAMPVIFRGIKINPLDPANFSYLLWLRMGYMVVPAVLVVPAGRLADMFGRARVYKFGFAIFTIAAIGLSLVWSEGAAGAIGLIILGMVQAVGGPL